MAKATAADKNRSKTYGEISMRKMIIYFGLCNIFMQRRLKIQAFKGFIKHPTYTQYCFAGQPIIFTLQFYLTLEKQQTLDEETAEELEGEVSLDVFKDWMDLSLPITMARLNIGQETTQDVILQLLCFQVIRKATYVLYSESSHHITVVVTSKSTSQ